MQEIVSVLNWLVNTGTNSVIVDLLTNNAVILGALWAVWKWYAQRSEGTADDDLINAIESALPMIKNRIK